MSPWNTLDQTCVNAPPASSKDTLVPDSGHSPSKPQSRTTPYDPPFDPDFASNLRTTMPAVIHVSGSGRRLAPAFTAASLTMWRPMEARFTSLAAARGRFASVIPVTCSSSVALASLLAPSLPASTADVAETAPTIPRRATTASPAGVAVERLRDATSVFGGIFGGAEAEGLAKLGDGCETVEAMALGGAGAASAGPGVSCCSASAAAASISSASSSPSSSSLPTTFSGRSSI
mmetsp:Transcript_36858/g.113788  ORF Transcript_36858/g.113788 Transcript_36858/m.113788 type:complete len:233 (+) Transcript_36858:1729-2427(+)